MAFNNPLLDDRLFSEYNKLYNEVTNIRTEYDAKMEELKKLQVNSILKNNYLNHIVIIILEKINQLSTIAIENKKDITTIKDEIRNINIELQNLKDIPSSITYNNPVSITETDFNLYKNEINNMINNNLKFEIISEIIKSQNQEKELLSKIESNKKTNNNIPIVSDKSQSSNNDSLNILDMQRQNDNFGWRKVKPKKNKIKLKNK